jgi:hypothetical protein
MQSIVTRACGHQEKVAIYGPYKARESRLEYEATKLCADCYRKQKAAEQAAAKDEVADVIRRLGLPELEGTPKQIAWAEAIRQKRVAELIARVRECGRTVDELLEQWGKGERGQYVYRAFGESSAAAWIDTRDLSYKDWVLRYHESSIESADPIRSILG